MNIIWKRMGESGKNWKMVFKSLDLLEYLLKRGSERVIAEAQGRQYQVVFIENFLFFF
jgi:epsin